MCPDAISDRAKVSRGGSKSRSQKSLQDEVAYSKLCECLIEFLNETHFCLGYEEGFQLLICLVPPLPPNSSASISI